MKYKITLKTEEDGKASVSLNSEDYATWVELTKSFSDLLKTLGFCPKSLDEFLENLEDDK